MTPADADLVLAPGLGEWEVTTVGGDQILLVAHGFKRVGADHVFVVLTAGRPDRELTIARVPSALVRSVHGG